MIKPFTEKLSVVFDSPADKVRAGEFAVSHQLPLLSAVELPNVATDYYLYYQQGRTAIGQTGKGAPGPVSASFIGGKAEHRRKFGGGKGQLIAKAVGLKSGLLPTILDATAGLGRDAYVLATLGCSLTLLECSPLIHELLATALEEARSDPSTADIAARMQLRQGDALSWMLQQTEAVADVIYLDPMYPQRDKSAQVKKEMRVFHDLVGSSLNDAELLAAALEKARYRVVVKRPRKGVAIEGPTPSLQLLGKSSRYDIYTLQSMVKLKATV